MLSRQRRHRRVRFLPQLPSNDLVGWIENQRNRGDRNAPCSSKTSVQSSLGSPAENYETTQSCPKRRRQDFPLIRSIDKAAASNALRSCGTPSQLRGALDDLFEDMCAATSRAPRDALLRTWFKFHEQWFGKETEVLPLTEDKVLKIAALFKRGGYKSVKNYFSRIKDHHVMSGFDWSDKLDTVFKKCTRSVLRGLGGPSRSEAFNFSTVVSELQGKTKQLAGEGPVNPAALIVAATLFMLREVQQSAVELTDVTFNEGSVTLKLPVSKVDWQAKGCTRTWNCLCDKDLPCPMHVLRDHVDLLGAMFGDQNVPLFPTVQGKACTKQGVVDTIRAAVLATGGLAKDSTGNWCVSGHTFRITGARLLCSWGLDPITIQLIGRWGSSAVLTYLSEAPLDGFHNRIAEPLETQRVTSRKFLQGACRESDWDTRANMKDLLEQHNELVSRTEKIEKSLKALSTIPVAESESSPRSTERNSDETWAVRNLISDVLHRTTVNLNSPPSAWKTLCG